MMKLLKITILILIQQIAYAANLPDGFVYLKDIAPSIQQDIRYYGYHNFIARPVRGYLKPECILTQQAANALAKAQQQLIQKGYGLKVYDCYRPQMAVDDFITWSKYPKLTDAKHEFYPRVKKQLLFQRGYVAERSGHSRGSTVDLTIVPINSHNPHSYIPGKRFANCYHTHRYKDNSIDMGTAYDCLDPTAHYTNAKLSAQIKQNRKLLRYVMVNNGFEPYSKEWWHFTLIQEPYPEQYFNFPVA